MFLRILKYLLIRQVSGNNCWIVFDDILHVTKKSWNKKWLPQACLRNKLMMTSLIIWLKTHKECLVKRSIQKSSIRWRICKKCKVIFVYRTYVLERERERERGRCKIFFGWYMEFISGGSFTKQQFLQTNNKLHGGVESPTKNIRSSTKHRGNQADT